MFERLNIPASYVQVDIMFTQVCTAKETPEDKTGGNTALPVTCAADVHPYLPALGQHLHDPLFRFILPPTFCSVSLPLNTRRQHI